MAINPFTGMDDGEGPLRPIVNTARNAASSGYDALFGDPKSRAALLQIGLGLMQPVGIGQTVGGHIANAIGGGGEAVARQEKEEMAQRQQDLEEEYKRGTLGLKERETKAYERGQDLRGVDQRLEAERLRQQGRMQLQGVKDYTASAKAIFEHVNGITAEATDPLVQQYKGKTPDQIADMLKAKDATSGGGSGTPSNLPPGAKQAPDGNYYVPDPKRPGKYLKVNP